MRVPRIHLPDLPTEDGAELWLEGDEAAHLTRVLRLRPGAAVEGFDGRGAAARLRLEQTERRRVLLCRVGEAPAGAALSFELTLVVATPKGKRAHRLVEALTELGVSAFAPLLVERGAAPPPPAEQALRWALEACKQCGRNAAPRILPAQDLAAVRSLAREHDLSLLPDTADAARLADALPEAAPGRVLAVVGPEGGFSDAERRALRDGGLRPVRLAPTVLRIETAAEAMAAALVARWG